MSERGRYGRYIQACTPGLKFHVIRERGTVLFNVIHASSNLKLLPYHIHVQGGGGVTRLMRVADAVLSDGDVDWTRSPGQLQKTSASRIRTSAFLSWLTDGRTFGTKHAKVGAPEKRCPRRR